MIFVTRDIKMHNDDLESLAIAVFVLICIIGLSMFWYHQGYNDAEKDVRVQAIERNVAHWETNSKGEVKFVWNEEPNKTKCGD